MMKVLVVEGSKRERLQMVEALAQLSGVAVMGAVSDVQSALRALATEAPDILVTGVELEDGAGLDLIQAAHEVSDAAIVVVGERASREEWRRHLEAGADRFVDRAVGPEELQEVVTALADGLAAEAPDPMILLGRMTAGVANDLGNHLATLEAMLKTLDRDPHDALAWQRVHTVVAALTRVARTLLGQVRGDRVGVETLDFGALARSAVDLVWGSIPGELDVVVDVAEDMPPIRGIAVELEALVFQLVLDAADALADGGALRIVASPVGMGDAATPDRPGVVLQVATTGPRREPKKSARGELGLEVARRIARRHRAQILAHRDTTAASVSVILPVA